MALVFVHGVNTRMGDRYTQEEARLRAFLTERVLTPLGWPRMEISTPYWGQFGVDFHWRLGKRQLAVIPQMGSLESARSLSSEEADLPPVARDALEAALADEGEDEGLGLSMEPDEGEVAAALFEQVRGRLPSGMVEAGGAEPESLGSRSFAGLGQRLLRICTAVAANRTRHGLQLNLSRFMGDAFVYARDRGTPAQPGPILGLVRDALRAASRPSEPTIVITYSMGGNIVYDLLTTFARDLRIAAWVAVGSQVAHFEDMKLFSCSDARIGAPTRVPKPDNLEHWINVFDPIDPCAFAAEPVFEGVRDVRFATGQSAFSAHRGYFGQPAFYELLREQLAKLAR